MNIYDKFKNGLKKSSSFLSTNIINSLISKKISDEILEEIETTLISADIGLEVTNQLINRIKKNKINSNTNTDIILNLLAKEITNILKNSEKKLIQDHNNQINILLFIGVNGSGKTTTIGKLINKIDSNKKILIAACDTFRAAAVEQLKKWTSKDNVTFFHGFINQDPASVAFNACKKTNIESFDYLIIDTAGRLSNNTNLINQLIKIKSVIQKSTNIEIINSILVLDGTNGSNMIKQVDTFKKIIGITGLIITKLDGTAKGGAIIPIAKKYQIPIHFVGLGEQKDDLLEFDAEKFSYSLLGLNN